MKCNQSEQWILLQDAGELAAEKSGALAAHLHDCDACRRFQHALIEAHNEIAALAEPRAKVVMDVLREARLGVPQRKRTPIWGWKPAYAAATAAILVVAGLLIATRFSNPVGLELIVTATQLMEPDEQIVSVMYSGLSEDDLAFNFIMTYSES